jgi:hypothetical protein
VTTTLTAVSVRRRLATAVLVLAVPAVSGCGINFDAQTGQVYNPSVGVDDRSGSVDVLNALVVSGAQGSGTVIATLVNNDQTHADSLTALSGAGRDSSLQITTGGTTRIPAQGLLNLAEEGRNFVRGSRVQAGYFVEITFSFDRGKSVTMGVPVVSADQPEYGGVPLPGGS